DVGLDDAAPVDDQRVRDHHVERIGVADALLLAHAIAQHLAAAELALVAVRGVIALDLEPQLGVAEPHAIAGGRPVQIGVVPPVDHGPRRPVAHDAPPAIATSVTVRASPGSKRTAVPAGISRRMPRAAARSKRSAVLVSANG